MLPTAYIISVTASDSQLASGETVRKLTQKASSFFSLSKDGLTIRLFFALEGQENPDEVAGKLQDAFGFDNVQIVVLGSLLDEATLANVRHLFKRVEMDASKLTDDELSLFIESARAGQHHYFFEPDTKVNENGLYHLRLGRQEHVNLLPLEDSDTFEDEAIVTETVMIYPPEIDEDDTEPPPPVPPSLNKMSDSQIKKWVKEFYRPKLEDKQIQVNRSPDELVITISLDDDEIETWNYKLR